MLWRRNARWRGAVAADCAGEIPRTPSDIAVAAADVRVLEVMPALLLMVIASQAEHLKQNLRRVRGSEPVVGRCDLREKHWSNDADGWH